jgi:serine kinase of HPr protein (carbohydrate metabolism regulator)
MSEGRVLVHATSVALADAAKPFGGRPDIGVLIMGGSGSGKSDVALRLIAAGARLISDDQTALFAFEGDLYAEAPPTIAGQMEVRGVGIVPVEPAPPTALVLTVKLSAPEADVPRMPDHASYDLPPALQSLPSLPLITLRPFDASTPAKIVAAAVAAAAGKFG